MEKSNKGTLHRIAGPVVIAKGMEANMYDVVKVGNEKLMGEVIQINGDKTIIQVYEDTSGIKPGEPVINTRKPLSIELGPGLLKNIYDGIQRPLHALQKMQGDYIFRGLEAPGLDNDKKWEFKATVKENEEIKGGQVIGEVEEVEGVTHRIMAPPYVSGRLKKIKSGLFTINDAIAELENGLKITMKQTWPVRKPRPTKEKLNPNTPLITGQRIIDALFPIAKGGVAAIPGPFGAGKTVMQQSLAKWVDADIIVYVGCGERGNEMTEVLEEFPKVVDPKNNKPLFNRTILIANTSNMPVAAREASIYTGITMAEYFRDMGYSVALMADSTSRWAEALREISSRLEEMPGEEGYPAYLATRLAQFYERAGKVTTIDGKEGSITVIGAVSPPGGDFSEPVTQNTLRVTKVFWALDAKLAQRRHFPAINWLTSYSLYRANLKNWFDEKLGKEYSQLVNEVMSILQQEEKLLQIVQLVGSDSLPDKEQLVIEVARMLREFFLQQNAYHIIDSYCEPRKTKEMMKTILLYYRLAEEALARNIRIQKILVLKSRNDIVNVKFNKDYDKLLREIEKNMQKEFASLG